MLPVNCVNGCCLLSVYWMSGALSSTVFWVIAVFRVVSIIVGSIVVHSVIIISSSASSEIAAVSCVSSCGFWGVKGSPINGFSVVVVCSVVGLVIVIIGSGVWKSSPMNSLSSLVDCSSCCGL